MATQPAVSNSAISGRPTEGREIPPLPPFCDIYGMCAYCHRPFLALEGGFEFQTIKRRQRGHCEGCGSTVFVRLPAFRSLPPLNDKANMPSEEIVAAAFREAGKYLELHGSFGSAQADAARNTRRGRPQNAGAKTGPRVAKGKE